jgi:hypothetical protein
MSAYVSYPIAFVVLCTLAGCVSERTVFRSTDGNSYFKAGVTEAPAPEVPQTSPAPTPPGMPSTGR